MHGNSFETKRDHSKHHTSDITKRDVDRSYKRTLGTIYQVDPQNKGRATCTIWLQNADGSRRLFADGREIMILNSPLDLLMRFGGLRPGMIVEVSWSGTSETGGATATVVGEPTESKLQTGAGEQIPQRTVDTQSSLPFEPMGI